MRSSEWGAVLFITFLMMLVLAGLALGVSVFSHNSVMGGKGLLLDTQAFYIAEAGWQRSRQALGAATWSAATSPGNTYTESFGAGEYKVTIVDNGDGTDTITSEGYVPNQTSTVAKRKIVETSVPATTSGTNLSLTATASASSATGGHPAADAKDNSLSTFWGASNQGSGEWLAMNFGSAKTVNQVVVEANANIAGISAVEISSNGSSWSSVSGLSVSSSGSTWTADFTATTYQYIRAVFTSTASNKKVSVYEMRTFGPATLGQGAYTTQW